MSGAEIPLAMTIGSAAIGGASSLFGASASADALEAKKRADMMAARETAAAQEFEGRQFDRSAIRVRSAAGVDEANRRDDLVSSLETINVLRAGRGLDLDSPTGRAIASGVTATAERNIMQSKTNYMLEAANRELQGELSRRKARFSLMAGDASSAATDATIDATWITGIGRAASSVLDVGKTLRTGGWGSNIGGASP